MTNTTRPAEEDGGKGAALMPCPFCGGAAHFEMDDDRWEWIECGSCGMQGNRSASLGEDCKPLLREAWNRRAAPGAAAAAPEEQATTPEWMTCSSRAPWVANSLRSRAQELRGDEKRSRGAYQKDYMGVPTRYFADALGDAAAAIEARLRVVETARAAQAQGGAA